MKIITKYILVGVVASLIGFGCDGGQIQFGPSVDGVGPSGIAITDPTGVSLNGGELDPTVPIIIRFPDEVPNVDISVDCDGEPRPLTLTFLGEDTISAMDEEGRWPQKADCFLRLLEIENVGVIRSVSKAYDEASFRTKCGAWDYFDDLRTMDREAPYNTYGEGCWKVNVSSPYSWDRYNMVGGQLVIDVIDSLDLPGLNYIAAIVKTIVGVNYEVTLKVDDLLYEFPQVSEGEEKIMYYLIATDWQQLVDGSFGIPAFNLSYEASYDKHAIPTKAYVCYASNFIGAEDEEKAVVDCGEGKVVPTLGFIKQESVYTPRYSLDGGETWSYFYDGSGLLRFDLPDFAEEVDLAVGANSIDTGLGEWFVDEVEVIGDAVFVE